MAKLILILPTLIGSRPYSTLDSYQSTCRTALHGFYLLTEDMDGMICILISSIGNLGDPMPS